MKKILVALTLLGFLSQPVLAQCVDSASELRPAINNCSPVARPINCQCGCQCGCQTGGAASLQQTIQPTIQAVKIPKKHWYNFTRTGYRAVYPAATGYAVQLQQTSCNCQPGMTTGAAAAIPIISSNQNVLVPKRHFWEHDKIQLMNVCPSTITGFAVPIYQNVPCAQPPVEPQCQPQYQQPLPQTGGAAPVKKKPVRGYW